MDAGCQKPQMSNTLVLPKDVILSISVERSDECRKKEGELGRKGEKKSVGFVHLEDGHMGC